MKENPISFQMKYNPEDFMPASEEEKESLVVMRESVSFWKDGLRRLCKNKVAMVSLVVIILIMFISFIVPQFIFFTIGKPFGLPTTILVLYAINRYNTNKKIAFAPTLERRKVLSSTVVNTMRKQ